MKKRIVSLILALVLCMALAVPASAASQNAFASEGISVMQETPNTLSMTYVIYDPNDISCQKTKEGKVVINSCTMTPSSKAGYMDVELVLTAYMELEYVSYKGEYSNCMWSSGAFDYYTGIFFDFGSMMNDAQREITTKVRFNERDYAVSCSKKNEWSYGGWVQIDADTAVCDAICKQTTRYTVPKGHNGLVYGLYETTEVTVEDITPSSASDLKNGDDARNISNMRKNGQFFRFGHEQTKEMPRDGLVLSIYDQGDSKALGYTIANHGNEDIKGYYALLSYWPKTTYYPATEMIPYDAEIFTGQILPLDVDLAPGESMSGDCWSVAVGWSTMTHKWIKFDSKAERDAFFKDSALSYELQSYYEIDNTDAGIKWMKDTFGITIRSGK